LHEGNILADGSPRELLASDDPRVRYFFQLELEKSHSASSATATREV
jgi:ABC-type transporter Mla maintaining outer membrane lipid asymmetry ATPase subunit MlaF